MPAQINHELKLLQSIDKKLDTHIAICKLYFDTVDTHDKTLNGNGNGGMGLKSKVYLLLWVLGILASAATFTIAAVMKNSIGL